MRKIGLVEQIDEIVVEDRIKMNIDKFLQEKKTQLLVSYYDYTICSLALYNIEKNNEHSGILLYQSKKDIYILGCDKKVMPRIWEIEEEVLAIEQERGDKISNERYIYFLLCKIIQQDRSALEDYESEIIAVADLIIEGLQATPLQIIVTYRRELMEIARYLENVVSLVDEFLSNENALLSEEGIRLLEIVRRRGERCQEYVLVLREHIEQMRESYQAQIDIKQNDLMKIFTVVTSIFSPLTLLVGWYGMNFNMPEFQWKHGYAGFIGISISIFITLIVCFKKKKWI